jgi:hypothetical protein
MKLINAGEGERTIRDVCFQSFRPSMPETSLSPPKIERKMNFSQRFFVYTRSQKRNVRGKIKIFDAVRIGVRQSIRATILEPES